MKIPTTTDIPQRYTWCLAGICYSSLAILPSFLSYAESYFNPAFLLENGTSVADLSRFERGNHQPAGVYRVDLWRNDEFIGSQDIVFESTTENTGDKSGGLMSCFNQVLLERIGLNSSAFPELAQQQNNKCINLLKAVPDATINFDFAAMRLNITIPQIALLSSAHGYIPPEEWDEGIPALLLNYNFTVTEVMVTIAIFLVSSAGLILARGVYATMVPGTIFAEMDIIQNSGIILAPGYSAPLFR